MILKTSDQFKNSDPIITNEGKAHVILTCFQLIRQKQY